jgi:hypothetical protein
MKKILIVTPLSFIFVLFIFIMMIKTYLNKTVEELVRGAGFPQATVEKTVLDTDSIVLMNIDSGDGIKVDTARISLSLAEIIQRKSLGMTIVFERARKEVPTFWGNLLVQAGGKVFPYGAGMRLNAFVSGQSSFADFTGQMTSDIATDGARKDHFELTEGKIAAPDLLAWRVTGWIASEEAGNVSAQIRAGAVQGQGARLNGADFSDVTGTFDHGRLILAGIDRLGRRVEIDIGSNGAFCNGRAITTPFAPTAGGILEAAQRCAAGY